MALVEISQKEGRIPVTFFQLQDRVNLGNFAELEQTAKDSYDNGVRDLVIDLSEIPSLTSIGVRALVVIHKLLSTDQAKHLKLAGPIAYVRPRDWQKPVSCFLLQATAWPWLKGL